MEYKFLDITADNNIVVVKINRAEKLNALNSDVVNSLRMFFQNIESDKNVKIVVLTGAGDKAFVAGADISEMVNFNTFEAHEFCKIGINLLRILENSTKIIISAVNGYAFRRWI